MEATNYVYDPEKPQLVFFRGNTPAGGFIGHMATKQFMKLIEEGVSVMIGNLNDEKSRRQKVQRLRAIWVSQGIDSHRHAILEGYGVTSTADLTHEQLDELIRNYSAQHNKPASDEIRRLRSAALMAMQRLGVYNTSDDWAEVNRYMLQPRICGKLLYQCNTNELKKLIRKLNSIADSREKKLQDEVRKSAMN